MILLIITFKFGKVFLPLVLVDLINPEVHHLPFHPLVHDHLLDLCHQVIHSNHLFLVLPFLLFVQHHKVDILHLCLLLSQVILVFLEDLEVHPDLFVLAVLVDQVVQEFLQEHHQGLLLVLDNLFLPFVLVFH